MLVSAALRAAAPENDPVLPLSIPGYELRSLDVRKPVVFDVNGDRVRISLPIFLYCPAPRGGRSEALRLLRQAYDDAIRLGRQSEWSAADLQRIIAALDGSIRQLECQP